MNYSLRQIALSLFAFNFITYIVLLRQIALIM